MGADKGQSCEEVLGQPQRWHRIKDMRWTSYSLSGRRRAKTEEKAARAARRKSLCRALPAGDLCPQECSKTWKQDGDGVWGELSGLLTDRSCLRSAASYDGDGGSDKAGPERLFSDVSVNKMEEEGSQHNSVTFKKINKKFWFKMKHLHGTGLKIVTLLYVCVHNSYCWPCYLFASCIIFIN